MYTHLKTGFLSIPVLNTMLTGILRLILTSFAHSTLKKISFVAILIIYDEVVTIRKRKSALEPFATIEA